jgi:hypothetical protein
MPTERPVKDNHLIYADAVQSRNKSGVWFGEQKAFKDHQANVLEKIKDRIDWVPLENAVLAVSIDPPGICIIAPNPSLPGIIVLADGATPENTATIRQRYIDLVRASIEDAQQAAQLESTSQQAPAISGAE